MARGSLTTVLLVALVATAGCSAPFADSTPVATETVTPAPVPDESQGPDRTAELAPGLTEEGIVDAASLVGAHTEALFDTSYTARLTTTRTAGNGTVLERYDRVLRTAGPERFRYVLTVETPNVERRTDRWRDGERAYEAVTRNGTTTYRTLDDPTTPTLLSQEGLVRLFRTLPSRVTDTRTADGTTTYRVAGGPGDLAPLSNVSYVLHVTDRGRITSFRVTYVRETATDRPLDVTVDASVVRVGETTVERPAWYDEAT